MSGVRTEPLGKFSIIVSSDHTFGTDAVLLADFAGKRHSSLVCDFGTGCGIIPLLLIKSEAANRVYGVEIQSEAVALAEKSIELNGLHEKFCVLQCDIKEISEKLPKGDFDLVTCNPPYKADGAGVKNAADAAKIARHETLCTFNDVVSSAKKLLKFGGRLCVCHRPERLADVICSMRANGIEPKVFREVIQRDGNQPWLILVEGRSGGKRGMKIMPPLVVEKNGMLSDEMMEIYGDYKQKNNRKI